MSSIGDALFTKTQQKVLGLLYGNPERSFYLKEIVRLAGVGVGTIKRELPRMEQAGLIAMVHRGNQNHYQANQNCPIYNELRSIVVKTFGISDVIKMALLPLYDQIERAFIYGSVAKGTDTANSDIDVMIVTDSISYTDIMAALTDAEQILGRPINPSVYDKQQLLDKLQANNSFLTRVMEQPKIWIKGEEKGAENGTEKIGQSGKGG